jgi:serine-type D-Ala-D-Ala carboxypeptidase (penicillin-binding protein 5/6)
MVSGGKCVAWRVITVAFLFAVGATVGASAATSKIEVPCVSYYCVVADSGLAVSEHDADALRVPASMIKMMLMLMVAEGLEDGSWTLETPITASANAQRIDGAQVYLRAGEEFPLSQYMHAVAILSANDAAFAVAEGLWGSEADYLIAANVRAAELGMTSTIVRSPHGLMLGEEKDLTTARDMAILARACVSKPQIMSWVGHETYTFRENGSERRSTNRLQLRMSDCDGLKTGYTRAAGWCFTATAERDGVRLIAVVMGCSSVGRRFDAAEWVLEDGFSRMQRVRLLEAGQQIDPEIAVENAKERSVRLAVTEPIMAVVDTTAETPVRYVADLPPVLRAPIEAGSIVGTLKAKAGDLVLGSAPLAVPHNLETPSWPWKVRQSVMKQRKTSETTGGIDGNYRIVGAD